jgi:hypothetical protein
MMLPKVRQVIGAISLTLLIVSSGARAATLDFHGRASGWLGASWDTSFLGQAGLRYLPEARLSFPVGSEFAFDAEASVNGFVSADARTFDRPEAEARLKPYRAFVRLSSAQFEARAGLQKINFGSATLLRPLMWFDRVDPRDPLELTDGVYGLLARYYFQNNINIWAWGLLGNSAPKGWELYGSERWVPEPGARVQVPVPRGEVAATYHHRRAEVPMGGQYPASFPAEEDRIAFDGKWDVGVGLAFEATLMRQVPSTSQSVTWQRAATVGVDYTFGVGNGLGFMAEHMLVGAATEPFGRGPMSDAHVSALMLSYPIGILDNLRAIALYDWRGKGVYRYLAWQRTLDSWLFSVSAFWNPDTPVSLGAPGGGAAGKGIQLMVVFNH